mgnify:CR=1 FL=1
MKKFIALLLSFVMVFCMTTNVFAAVTKLETATPVATIRIDGYDTPVASTKKAGFYYYNTETGAITFVEGKTKSDTYIEGTGNIILPSQTNAKYAFTATTKGTTYHYQVLDEITGADGKKQYYIYCNDIYGKNPATSATDSAFDPAVETNVAYWLNNAFLNGTAGSSYVALDTDIKDYIQDHDWIVESNGKLDTEKYGSKDYSVNCKIALLSISEYAKYADKIGYGPYDNGRLSSAGLHMYLRSPSDGSNIRTLYAANGCTASTSTSYKEARIRPSFYVSEDYFKNVKLDLANMGSEVKKIVSELGAGIYTDPADKLALKNITVYTEDATVSALDTAKWTNGAKATVANGSIQIPKGVWIGRKTNMQGGTVSIEADVISAAGGGLYIGFRESGTASPSFRYPLYLNTSGIVAYYEDHTLKTVKTYKRLEDTQNKDLWYTKFSADENVDGTYRLKLTVNLDNGNFYAVVDGKTADGTQYVKYSALANVKEYVNKNVTFSEVAFWNSTSAESTKLNNIKITYDQNGSAIKTIRTLDKNTMVMDFEDYIDLTSVTASDVNCSDNTAVSAVASGNKLTVKFEKTISQSDGCVIVNNLKRSDIPGAEYSAIGSFSPYTYETVEYAADVKINGSTFTSGSTFTATANVTAGNVSEKTLELILAAYKGNKIVGISEIQRLTVSGTDTSEQTKTASLTLDTDADTVKAFLWDENMLPAAFDAVSAN